MTRQRAIVVGAGLGGLRSAEALRDCGFDGELIVFGDESWAPYNRPPLSKAALTSETDHQALAFRCRATATDIDWRLGTRVERVDVANRLVHTEDLAYGYDALVLATGVSPRRLSWPRAPAAPTHVVRTLEDAQRVRAQLGPGRQVLVIGAGFIGCEIAATARKLGSDVHCVAMDELPMIRPLGTQLAGELKRRHEDHGVTFHLGHAAAAVAGDQGEEVVLTDGTHLKPDLIVEAIGSRCNTDMVADCGFDLGDGVLVDSALRPLARGAAIDGVAVVGDLARFPNPRFGDGAHRVEHWSIPTATGRRAGSVLASYLADPSSYDVAVSSEWSVLPTFWSDQYDLRLQSIGMPGLGEDAVVLEGKLDDECIVGYHRDSHLVGVVALGMTKRLLGYHQSVGL